MGYYHDASNIIRKEVLQEEAEREATKFVKTKDGRLLEKDSISSAQLRRFYGEFKGLEKRLGFAVEEKGNRDEAFKKILPLVKMVNSKVAYAKGSGRIISPFADWLKKHIDQINNVDDFQAFLLHFEAVVGYCVGLGLKNK